MGGNGGSIEDITRLERWKSFREGRNKRQ